MADLVLDQNDIIVRLGALEALATWRREVRVPLRDLRMVHVEEEPLGGLPRLRVPGLWWPGVMVLGTARHCGRREFAAVHAGRPAVVLDLEGGSWERLVVSCPDAVVLAADLAALLLERGPHRGGHKPPGLNGGGPLQRGVSMRAGPDMTRVPAGAALS